MISTLSFLYVQAEVVEMNPAEAIAANLARLSYNASLRARAALRRAAARLSIGQVSFLTKLLSFYVDLKSFVESWSQFEWLLFSFCFVVIIRSFLKITISAFEREKNEECLKDGEFLFIVLAHSGLGFGTL